MDKVKKYTFPNSKYNDPNYVSPKVFHGRSFVTNKDAKKRNWVFANKIDYNSREVATENNNEVFKYGYLGREEIHENKKIIFRNSKYERILYFTKEGAVRYKNNQKRTEYYDKLKSIQDKHELSCLYESFISFEDNFFNTNIKSKYTEEEMFYRIKPQIEKYILNNDFDLANVEYFVSFHTNTDSFHFHFDFIEKVPTRIKNKLKEKELGELRKNIMFELNEELRIQNYERLSNLQSLKEDVQNIIDNVNVESYYKLIKQGSNILRNKKYRYFGDIYDNRLKEIIRNIKVLIIEDDKVLNNKLKHYKKHLMQKDNFDLSLYGNSDRRYSKKQIEEIDKRINNKVFKILKEHSSDISNNMAVQEGVKKTKNDNYMNEYIYDNKSNNRIKKSDVEFFENMYLINRNIKNNIYKQKKVKNRVRKRIKEEEKVFKNNKLEEYNQIKGSYEKYERSKNYKRFKHIIEVHKKIDLDIKDVTKFFTILDLKYQDKKLIEKKISKHISEYIKEKLDPEDVYKNGYLVKDSIMRLNFQRNGKLPLLRKLIVKRNKIINIKFGSMEERKILQEKIDNYNHFINILLTSNKQEVEKSDDKISRQVLNALENEEEAQSIKGLHRKISADKHLGNYLELLGVEDKYIINDINDYYINQKNYEFDFFINGGNKVQKFRTQKIVEEVVKKYDDFILNDTLRKYDKERLLNLLREYEVYKKYESKIMENNKLYKFKHKGFVSIGDKFLNIEEEQYVEIIDGLEITGEETKVFEKLQRMELYKEMEIRQKKYEALVKISKEECISNKQDIRLKNLITPKDEEIFKSFDNMEDIEYRKYNFINYKINKLNKHIKLINKVDKFRAIKNINKIKGNKKDSRKYEKIKYLEDKYDIQDEDITVHNLYLKKKQKETSLSLPNLRIGRQMKRGLRKHQVDVQKQIDEFERQITGQ